MSYAKKDEDAEAPGFKLDRTSVFQDGMKLPSPFSRSDRLTFLNSTTIQHVADITSKMPYAAHQDRRPSLHRREVPYERGHHSLFQYFEVIPEQGPIPATDGVLDR
jgi:hypothetical protein